MHNLSFHFPFFNLCQRRCLFGAFLSACFFGPICLARADGDLSNNPPVNLQMSEPYNSPTNGLGAWIWEEKTLDNQTCRFWKTFEIPAASKVTKARLVMTVDNEFTLYLDGREIGRGAEWRELFVFDLTPLLAPGRHVLAIDAYNGSYFAGMLFGLRIDLADGRGIDVKSDTSWRIVPDAASHWQKRTEAEPNWPVATIKAPLGGDPWWTAPMAVNMMPTLQPIKVFFWQTVWFQVLLLSVCGLVILASLWLIMQLALHQKERVLLEDERARIARDIHDDIGARMTQLVLQGEVAQNQLPDDSEMREQITWICEEARGLLSSLDEILWAINPRRDTLRDFADYVCNYAQEFLKPTRIQCRFAVDSGMPAAAFNLPLRRSLLMAIKEALNNAVKHSEATELCLHIQCQGPRLIVAVQDNGQGFDVTAAKSDRNGLTNMIERLRELGGSCVITSQPGQGCRVEFCTPLTRPLWSRIWGPKILRNSNSATGAAKTNLSAHSHDPTQC